VVDEVEQYLFGPLQIVDVQDQGPLGRDGLVEAPRLPESSTKACRNAQQ
jgi:hypothetical protein